ncbi:MAG: S8 family serine peptidase [Candidatus Doudnabacteria bacterium]|nr:S8 family serine peptidase [Candidatus Doudnabacteria bacterium]
MFKQLQFILIFTMVLSVAAPAAAAPLDIFGNNGTEILVKLKDSTESSLESVLARHQVAGLRSHLRGIRALSFSSSVNLSAKLAALNADPDVEFAEPNYTAHAYSLPNDQYFNYQWNMGTAGLNMPEVWNQATGLGAVVAVIDTGVAYENYRSFIKASDFENTRFVPGYNFVRNFSHANDDNGHGTHVAGTIAQSTNNGTGVAGMAYNAQIMPLKALDSAGSGKYSDIADAIVWAADRGANIINLSLGGPYPSETMRQALEYAKSKGVLIVAATGNDGAKSVGYPAAYDDYVLAVGATRYDKTVTAYSNQGQALDVVAPGGDTKVDQDGNGYGDGILQQTFTSGPKNMGYFFFQGTSMATPHVAGLAALLVEKGITNPDELQNIIQASADNLYTSGWDSASGWGLINPLKALELAVENQAETIPDPDPESDSGEDPASSAGWEEEPQVSEPEQQPEPNKKPVAKFNSQSEGLIGEAINFDASASTDEDGSITNFAWDFGDGSSASGAKISHSYSKSGTYLATLTVTDNAQDSASFSANIKILEPEQKKFMHVSSIDLAARGSFLRISASATVKITDSQGKPVRNATVSGQWDGLSSGSQTLNTNSRGEATFSSDRIWRQSGEFIFSVKSVSHEEYEYNPQNNEKSRESVQIGSSRSFSLSDKVRGLMN